MIEQLAMNWYHAEQPSPKMSAWSDIPEDAKEAIRRRVQAVLEGDVRRSDLGVGDRAIWLGRTRIIDAPPADVLAKFGDHPHARKSHWWDCIEFGGPTPPAPCTRLFGNYNIGNFNLTNLQVAGMLSSGQSEYVAGWYLSMPVLPDYVRPLEEVLADCTVTFGRGDRPQIAERGIDLWREPRPINVLVPVRQNVHISIEFYGTSFRHFHEICRGRFLRDGCSDPFRIHVHLEGWALRAAVRGDL